MKVNIIHVFFDLDRTLWDFEKSAEQAFDEIFDKYKLVEKGISSAKDFHNVYTIHNNRLWDQYRLGRIKKEVLRGLRFNLTLEDFDILDDKLGEDIGNDYVHISPLKVNLFPYSLEILAYLFPKYKMHIITNGFSEVQETKLKVSGMGKYFTEVITSEEAGVKKPDPLIFQFAFNKTGARPYNSIMIGDDYEVDIIGARDVNMKQIFFDPENKFGKNGSTYYINCLKEIEGIL
ncbi:MAG: noncanonical pyrimidine nucleotidase, YjjG family [Candidatus Brocadiales bacterium]|nr:noncanonical pyrimidine nucleotidase, YjjG family [Candidatus Brocadiales bacterium]MBL6944803.1 noncanonical pyrimidine nucleotidase, YjjG family [Bacteroidales bacterium]